MQTLVCNKQPITPQSYWHHGVFDMQIQSSKFLAKQALSSALITKTLKEQTKKRHHNGFTYGQCPNGEHWFTSMPSASPYNYDKSRIEIKTEGMSEYCRSVRVRYASYAGGKSRLLFAGPIASEKSQIHINTDLLYPGTVSLTCSPNNPNLGPQLWSLFPVQTQKELQIPFLKKARSLIDWIELVRKEHHLGSLKEVKLDLHATRNDVLHQKKDFLRVKRILREQGVRLIGENRVIGSKLQTMAWLLWNSPAHRDLILSAKADRIHIEERLLDNKQVSSVIFIGVKSTQASRRNYSMKRPTKP